MYIAATVLASLLLSTTALAAPSHGVVRRHQHAALAKVRAAAPAPVTQPVEASAAAPKQRLRKRCKARTSSGLASTPAASPSPAPASTSSPSGANLAPSQPHPSPATTSSSAAPPPPSHASSSPPPSSQAPSPSPAPSPSSSSASAPSGGGAASPSLFTGTQTGGEGTFYGTGLGACGITNHDTDHIAAVSEILFDGYPGYNQVNPNSNPLCGKKVNVSYQGKTTSVTITDRCVACGPHDLDFSPAAFDDLADPSVGRIKGITWSWD